MAEIDSPTSSRGEHGSRQRCRPWSITRRAPLRQEGQRPGQGQRQGQRQERRAIRVLLVEDLNLVRAALVALLGGDRDIEVVGQAECAPQLSSAVSTSRPDVVVVDVDLPEVDALKTVAALHERAPQCRVLVLAAAARPGLVRRALDEQVAGALDKDAAPARLTDSIRRVARGERAIDPDLAVAALCVSSNPLTGRELDVLRLAAGGASAHEIASELFLSGGTVRNYLSRVVTKTGARSRIDAIRIARESAWL